MDKACHKRHGIDQQLTMVMSGPTQLRDYAQASKMHIKGDPAVSERHAVIAWAADGWTLNDVGSSNGTLVNGERLEANGGQPHRLRWNACPECVSKKHEHAS